ncbi:hypothetical protein OWV82_007658 [Melia azedarach]|uniref:Uncharacterized protein n=2 Tax=Melia azedarach TaxID=155640 RepID=A0ACC1Y913_MELAZ|nr:hypothetical protein OWV82_007654 [Melia azedarach]KAJ4719723.1 hypothetical protein OWV82_007658 [Melia azedarach]
MEAARTSRLLAAVLLLVFGILSLAAGTSHASSRNTLLQLSDHHRQDGRTALQVVGHIGFTDVVRRIPPKFYPLFPPRPGLQHVQAGPVPPRMALPAPGAIS